MHQVYIYLTSEFSAPQDLYLSMHVRPRMHACMHRHADPPDHACPRSHMRVSRQETPAMGYGRYRCMYASVSTLALP